METCKLLFARFCTYYLVNGVLRVQRPDHGIEPVPSGALAQIELDLVCLSATFSAWRLSSFDGQGIVD